MGVQDCLPGLPFYKREGWDEKNGLPARRTPGGFDLKDFADTMAGKLGA
jgi:hypothetical protein